MGGGGRRFPPIPQPVSSPVGYAINAVRVAHWVADPVKDEFTVPAQRTHEPELIRPALQYMAAQPDGFARTSDLIDHLGTIFRPSGEDAEILDGRSDTKFSQKVRNLVSHRNDPNGIVGRGLAEYDSLRKGLTITAWGRRYIGIE